MSNSMSSITSSFPITLTALSIGFNTLAAFTLENVKAKTIQNEGMLLSDFGIYDSQKDDSGYKTAPVIRDIRENTNILELRKNLFSTLTGVGLTGVEVSIQESDRHGIQIISDFVRISDYSIKQKINSVFGQTYY